MSDKTDSYMTEDRWKGGREWHLEFPYMPEFPYPFPIVPAGTCDRHDAVGHLSADGRVHVFNKGIIEQLVRAGLRARVRENGTKSGGGNGG
jgi:hypothetical protein